MRDWAIDYILHVLEVKDWSANQLAMRAGLAASTISRPLRDKDYSGGLSRSTIAKIRDASGVDPAPFIPKEMAEDGEIFSVAPKTLAARSLAELTKDAGGQNAQPTNEIKIAVVGSLAQIVATVDIDGIAKLRRQLDAIETMLKDD